VDVIRRTDLQRLALGRPGPCVSVFLPTHRAGHEVEQAPIRLKNLLRQATDALKTDGVRAPEIDRLLAPPRSLLDDRLFWQYQSDGLALFSRPGWWRSFRVPLDLPELAVVDDRFHVTPLLPLLDGDGHFFVLALSQNRIRLLEGTRDRVEEVDLPGVPQGFGMPSRARRSKSSCSCMSPTAAVSAQVASTTATAIQARGKRSGSCGTSGRWIEGFVRC
jgi:hypothetical protein